MTYDSLGEEFLREWAVSCPKISNQMQHIISLQEATGFDQSHFMGDNPQSRVVQIHTLEDMMRDVESDEVLRGILKSTQQFDKIPRSNIMDPARRASVACSGLTARRISRITMASNHKIMSSEF